jgi:predicted Fe-Mo cluster-binding NifX family protein
MKIAVATNDNETISAHFGHAENYAVLTVDKGAVVSRELREKAAHRDFGQEGLEGQHRHRDDSMGRGHGRHSKEKHQRMFATITDCQVVLARGMGQGAYNGLQQTGIKPILTDIQDIESAVQAVIDGNIENHLERLH